MNKKSGKHQACGLPQSSPPESAGSPFFGKFLPFVPQGGRLRQTAAREALRFLANALLSPLILDIKRLRCSNCPQIFEAEVSRKFSSVETVRKATAEAIALSLLPFYRDFIKTENAGDWMPHTYRAAAAHAEKTLKKQGNLDGYVSSRFLRWTKGLWGSYFESAAMVVG